MGVQRVTSYYCLTVSYGQLSSVTRKKSLQNLGDIEVDLSVSLKVNNAVLLPKQDFVLMFNMWPLELISKPIRPAPYTTMVNICIKFKLISLI